MSSPRVPCLAFFLLWLPLACGASGAGRRGAEAAASRSVVPDPSALASAVQALEALERACPSDCVVEVRALAAEVRRASGARAVRTSVTFDLSVFAPTLERAGEALGELAQALARAGAPALGTPAAPERVRTALARLGPRAVPGALVSWSERLQVELEPVAGASGAPPVPASALDHEALEPYVRQRAAEAQAIGPVTITRASARPEGPQGGLRLLLAPGMVFQRYGTDPIGHFLASLEADSPAVRVTQLEIERSSHEPDPRNPRGWTFEAELTVRAEPERP